jgi:hypothetical protein
MEKMSLHVTPYSVDVILLEDTLGTAGGEGTDRGAVSSRDDHLQCHSLYLHAIPATRV